MTQFLKVIATALAGGLMGFGLLCTVVAVGVWCQDTPAAVVAEGPTTKQLAGRAFKLINEAAARMQALEEANRDLGVMLRESTEQLSKSRARVDLLEDYLSDNGVPTPLDDATHQSLKLEDR